MQKEGQNFRKAFQRKLPTNMNKDYYFIHRNTGNTEPIIVEYGFLDSSKDDVNLLKNNYKNLSEAVVRGVLEYINFDVVPNTDSDIYVVKKGDSLWSISKKYGISVDELKRINKLSSNLLSVGQTLKVVGDSPINNDLYIVKAGDTLYGIAKRYGIGVDDLKRYNNLTSNSLSIGQQLYIPTGQIVEDIVGTDYDTYFVKSGDTIYSIANVYGVNPSSIRDLNNLSGDNIVVGQKLLIPVSSGVIDTDVVNYIDYRVVSGDTLYDIASRYGVSVDELKRINNLSSNNLSIGQVIKIPVVDTKVYVVKKGDTLYSIARSYNVTPNDIMMVNGLTNNLLSVGQVLKIPNL